MGKENRNQIIIRTSVIGILINLILVGFKLVMGMISGSIAIILDAVNNLSDALGSLITIVAAKLAAKPADREHPFGYGRVEYLSTMIISGLVLYAGISSLIESVKGIIHPEAASYDTVTIIILVAAVAAKVILGTYFKKVGRSIDADSLVLSGEDATMDAVVSALTIVAAGVNLVAHISIEAWIGLVISVVIIKAGLEMLKDTLSRILGERVDKDQVVAIKKFVSHIPGVHGAYDLVMNDYGQDEYVASIHVAVDDTMSAAEFDHLTREIMEKVHEEFHINLAAVGLYSVNTRSEELKAIQQKVHDIVLKDPDVMAMHGFYYDPEKKYMSFDIVISFKAKNAEKLYHSIQRDMQEEFPGYTIRIQKDLDMSD